MRTPSLKIQHKNCLQSTLRKKNISTLFAGLGRSVLGKPVPSVLSKALGLRPRAVLKTSATVFPDADLPAGKYHICMDFNTVSSVTRLLVQDHTSKSISHCYRFQHHSQQFNLNKFVGSVLIILLVFELVTLGSRNIALYTGA